MQIRNNQRRPSASYASPPTRWFAIVGLVVGITAVVLPSPEATATALSDEGVLQFGEDGGQASWWR